MIRWPTLSPWVSTTGGHAGCILTVVTFCRGVLTLMTGIDTQTQLSRPLLLSCRIRLPCVGKVCTRAQAEPGSTRLLPNHLGLPQTNELRQCTLAGRYRSSTHQEDCCLPHGTHTPNNRRQTSTIPSPTNCKQIEVAEELHAHRHAARLVCKQQQAAALERQPDRRAILCQNGTGGGRVFAGWIWRGLALLASH